MVDYGAGPLCEIIQCLDILAEIAVGVGLGDPAIEFRCLSCWLDSVRWSVELYETDPLSLPRFPGLLE